MKKNMELTENYCQVMRKHNGVSATSLNAYELLMIIRSVLELCGKFLREAFEKEKGVYRSNAKSLEDYVFKFYLHESCEERREMNETTQINYNQCHIDIQTRCIYAEKVKVGKKGQMIYETWLLVTIEGKLLLVQVEIERIARARKQPYGYHEIVKTISLFLDYGRGEGLFGKQVLSFLSAGIAERILYYTLDILEFEKIRREEEWQQFEKAYEFRKQVLARISFPSKG